MVIDVLGTAFVLWLSWNLFLEDIINDVIKMWHKHKSDYSKGN